MGDPVPSSSISDATTGGLSVIVISGGSTGDVITKQSDGTYLPVTPASGGSPGGSSGQVQYNNAGAFGGMTAVVYAGTGTHVAITSQGASTVPLCVKGAISQSGNLQEWQSSVGAVLASVSSAGNITFGSTSSTQKVSSSRVGDVGLKLEFPDNGSDFDDGICIGSTSGEHFKISSRALTFGNLLQTYYRVNSVATSNLLWGMSDTQHIIYGGMTGGSINPSITLNAVTHATVPNTVYFKTASGNGHFVWGFHQTLGETPVMLDIRTAAGARTDRVELMDGGAWLTSAIDDAVDSQTAWVMRSANTLTQTNSRIFALCNNTSDVFSVGINGTTTIDVKNAAAKGLVIQAAASQSANLIEAQSSAGTVLSAVAKNGAFKIVSLANADAENSTLYYSTDAASLVWKDSGGTVHTLY